MDSNLDSEWLPSQSDGSHSVSKLFSTEEKDASEDKGWNYVVETTILEKEFEALGIDVNDTEFDSYLYGKDGFTVLPELLQSFADATGRLDEKKLQSTINQLQTSEKPEA